MPPLLPDNNYQLSPFDAFGPVNPTVSYGGENDPNSFFSTFTSGAVVLENENILVTVGRENKVLEFLLDGTLVWEYQLPTSFTFRTEKYPVTYPAFDGRDLTPMRTIEVPPSTVPCELISSSQQIHEDQLKVFYDHQYRPLRVLNSEDESYDINTYNIDGRRLWQSKGIGNQDFNLTFETSGIMFVNIINRKKGHSKVFKIFIGQTN